MKKDEREIARILERNLVPEVERREMERLERQARLQMEQMDILTWNAFPYRLMRQIPYITSWIWAVQALVVIVFAVLLRQGQGAANLLLLIMLSMGPLLALLLVVDVARSYGCNMWEMEAVCRYDLGQVTAMRMCIVGGADMAVLAACCCLYGRGRGSIWEFGLLAVFPFFVSSSVYLWELKRFSGSCSIYVLALTGAGLGLAGCPALNRAYNWMAAGRLEWAPALTLCMLGAAGAAMAYHAAGLCRHGWMKGGESGGWSLG